MISLFGDWIRNIGLFVIFSAFVEMLMPQGHFRKYIYMMMGLILMLILIRPITTILFENDNEFENLIEVNQLEMERKSILNQSNYIFSKQEELVIDTYKSKLKEQINKLVEGSTNATIDNIEIFVNENQEDSNYGEIEKVDMTIVDNNSPSKAVAASPIKPIKINIGKGKEDEKKDEVRETELEKNIKNSLINFYNLSSDNIHITVQKK